MKKLLFVFFVLSLFGCSMQQQLSGKYEGKGVEVLYSQMGEPKMKEAMGNGNTLFIYEKETLVKQTTIGTGRMTYDQRVSPSFIKVERYIFEVDNQGIIVKSNYKKNIE